MEDLEMSWRRLLILTVMIALFHTLFRVPAGRSEGFDCLIEPYVVINLSSAVAGRLDTVLVDRGARVKQGQIVATLESNVEQATVAMYRARATRESAIRAGYVSEGTHCRK
jgi:multidrug resistance efflux pump